MRISDWSSDVCSSDLAAVGGAVLDRVHEHQRLAAVLRAVLDRVQVHVGDAAARFGECGEFEIVRGEQRVAAVDRRQVARAGVGQRSEEHTSELQSLMRISYAVFCLKKKKK